MKIASANIQMESGHAETSRNEASESLRAWVGPRRPDFESREQPHPVPPSALVEVSDTARAAQSAEAEAAKDAAKAAAPAATPAKEAPKK